MATTSSSSVRLATTGEAGGSMRSFSGDTADDDGYRNKGNR